MNSKEIITLNEVYLRNGYCKVEVSSKLEEFLNSFHCIKFNDGTEVYTIDAVFVREDPNSKEWLMFRDNSEYLVYLKNKK